tara:strand:+ start:4142 stop:4999 length:858 start_codon:yes stop_codon:yes gene_type:complete
MNLLQLKNSFFKKLISFSSLIALFSFPVILSANENDPCPADGTKTKAQMNTLFSGNSGACMVTPDKYELTIYELGLCTSLPITGDAGLKVADYSSCVVTMESAAGATADLAGSTPVILPAAAGRPPNATYPYAYIIIGKTFGLKGSYKLSDVANRYNSATNGTLSSSNATAAAHTFNLTSFGDDLANWADGEDAEYGPESMGTGSVSALLINNGNTRSANAGAVTRLLGVFSANAGNSVVIDDSSVGLQVELKIKDAGYMVQFDNSGAPNAAISGPFVPEFTIFE